MPESAADCRAIRLNIERTPGHPQPSRLRRWLREPLLHFLLIGAALFTVYHIRNPGAAQLANGSRIELTEDDLRQIDDYWMGQWHRHPTREEWSSLIDNKIREEILYREALAMGLDQGDTIVRRRMAQKMDFLMEDIAALHDPDRQELKTWFKKNAERFALPPRITFHHLYFSPDKRGAAARADAARALDKLKDKSGVTPQGTDVADPFMFQSDYGDRTPEQIAGVFGGDFAKAVSGCKAGTWQGPIESGLGWHLVWIDSITPGRVPAYEEIESDVKTQWISEQRTEVKRRAFEAMKSRYVIIMPPAQTSTPTGKSVTLTETTK
jgi:peptidyl-prolyl cis-trans isomerase C